MKPIDVIAALLPLWSPPMSLLPWHYRGTHPCRCGCHPRRRRALTCHCFLATIMESTHADVDVALAVTEFTRAIVDASLTSWIFSHTTSGPSPTRSGATMRYSNCEEEGRVRNMERRVRKRREIRGSPTCTAATDRHRIERPMLPP